MRSALSSLTLSSQQYRTSLSVPTLTAYHAIKFPVVFYVMRICASGLPLFKCWNELIEKRWWTLVSQKKKKIEKVRNVGLKSRFLTFPKYPYIFGFVQFGVQGELADKTLKWKNNRSKSSQGHTSAIRWNLRRMCGSNCLSLGCGRKVGQFQGIKR